jgi:hypothetical protein
MFIVPEISLHAHERGRDMRVLVHRFGPFMWCVSHDERDYGQNGPLSWSTQRRFWCLTRPGAIRKARRLHAALTDSHRPEEK